MKKIYVIKTKYGTFKVAIWLDPEDRAYLVQCINLPSIATFGKTLLEAKKMAKDAIKLFCECAIHDGKVVADDNGMIKGKIVRSARILTLVS